MARTSISSIITSDFVNRFRDFASAATPTSGSLTSLLHSSASSASISSGLRFGAQAFTAGIQGLNAAISYVNLAGDSLEKLRDITVDLLDITERATKASTSDSTRRALNVEFQQLGHAFTQIIEDSSLDGVDYLSSDGLSEILKSFGLDENQSQSIANIFDKFQFTKSDNELASERIKGNRPVNISIAPPSSYIRPDTYVVEQVSDSGLSSTGESAVTPLRSGYTDTDTIFSQNSAQPLFLVGNGRSTTSMAAGTVSHDVQIMGADEVSNYFLVKSRSDFLGYNGSHYEQLYLVDANGTVVQQVTNNDGTRTYQSADVTNVTMPARDKRVVYAYDGTEQGVETVSFSSFGTDPTTLTPDVVETGTPATEQYYGTKISNSGDYLAYSKIDNLGQLSIEFYSVNTTSLDAFMSASKDTYDSGRYGFADDDTLIITQSSNEHLYTYDFGRGVAVPLYTTDNQIGSDFEVLQENGTNGAFLAFFNNDDSALNLYALDSTLTSMTQVTSLSLGSGAVVYDTSLSIAHDSHGNAIVGIKAQLPSLSGDSDIELYRFRYRPLSQLPVSTAEVDTIFEGSIDTRQDAMRTLEDLKALKAQIDANLKNLKTATDTINQNISLVRATGEAMLGLSSQIRDSEDAGLVAKKLQAKIHANAGAALSQIDNLQAILVAALTQ